MNYTSINITPNTGGAPSKYYFVEVLVIDLAGNSIKALAQVLVINDREAPVVEMIHPLVDGALSGKDNIYAIITDDGVIRTARYTIYNLDEEVKSGFLELTEADIYGASLDVSTLDDEQYFLEVVANDTAGRRGSSGLIPIKVDNTDPILRVLYPWNNNPVSGSVSILVDVDDRFANESHATFSIDGGPHVPIEDGFDTNDFVREGLHLVEVRVIDPAGAEDSVILSLYFDNDLPQVQTISPSDTTVLEGLINIVARVSDGAGIKTVEALLYEWGNRTDATPPDPDEIPFASVRLIGPEMEIVTNGDYIGTIDTLGLVDGKYLLVISAEDRSLETGMSFSYLPVDNNAPIMKVTSPVDGSAITGNFTPEAEVNDPFLAKTYFTFNGKEYDLGHTLDLRTAPDGMYTMRFVALDSSLRASIVELEVFVDRSAPIVEMLSPADHSSHTGVLEVLASVRENSGVRYVFLEMDGYSVALGSPIGEGGLYSFSLNLSSFNRSAHRITVKALNMAGLIGSSQTMTVYKDYLDTDGDGVMDIYDDEPYDPRVSGDIDGDGFGSYFDDDDDGDGILDIYEPTGESFYSSGVSKGVVFSKDPTEWLDTDGDGIGDNSDTDRDGDGKKNELDMFPLDISEWGDVDMDGTGDNTDLDIDGDGVPNDDDDLPYDPTEWKDTDGDGVGDNADKDDDNDGIPDDKDDYPLNASRHYNWWPVLFIAFIALLCALILFAGFVFRDRIDGGLQSILDRDRSNPEESKGPAKEQGGRQRPPRRKTSSEDETEDGQRKARKINRKVNKEDRPKGRSFKENERLEEEKEGFKIKWG